MASRPRLASGASFDTDQLDCITGITGYAKRGIFDRCIKRILSRELHHDKQISDRHALRVTTIFQYAIYQSHHVLIADVYIICVYMVKRFFIVQIALYDIF